MHKTFSSPFLCTTRTFGLAKINACRLLADPKVPAPLLSSLRWLHSHLQNQACNQKQGSFPAAHWAPGVYELFSS